MTPESLIAPARLARRPVLATQTDSRLVDLVRAGYEPAFETIVSRYRAALLRYAERFLPRERAEDAVQQSFVSAYEAMLRDDTDLNLRPWLYRIAHNASLNALRDRWLRHDHLDEGADGVERPDEALERIQGLRDVLTAVQALPDRQRDAIVLRELEGRSYEEIASELGVTDGSVRQLLNRARNTLRAGATAVVPAGLLLRLPWAASAEPVAARVAELGAGAGAGAVMAKLCATAMVTGAVVGGVAVAPEVGKEERSGGGDKAASKSSDEGESASAAPGASAGSSGQDDGGGGSGVGDPGGDNGDRGDDRGEGREDRAGEDRSGPGGGDDELVNGDRDEGETGEKSGSGRSGHSGSGGGSGSSGGSGSGSSSDSAGGSGSDSGSGSGSGSGSTESGGSGSGDSGSSTAQSEPETSGGSDEPEPATE